MENNYEYKVIDRINGRQEKWLLEFKDKNIPPMDELEKICLGISYLWETSIKTYPESGRVLYTGWID